MARVLIGITLCSGIGAPEVAAPWVDWRLASEVEAFPRAVLEARFRYRDARHHPTGPRLWGDMTALKVRHMRRLGIPLPDLIVAGTPCQSFSVAGLRQGTADPRGNLTLQFVRTCHAIVAARPDGRLAVLWENVPGVLSDRGNAFGAFLGGLVGAVDALPPPGDGSWPGEGMVQGPRARAAWAVLDARWFGVAQRRRRVFVVVDFGNCVDPAAILLEPDRLRGDSPPRREAWQDVARTLSARTEGGGGLGTDFDLSGGVQVAGHHGDTAGTVSAKWVKGSGGPAGDETQNMVAFDANAGGNTGMAIGDTVGALHNGEKGCRAAVAIQERAVASDLSQGPQGAGFRTDDCAYTLEARNKVQSVAVAGDTTHSLTGEGHDASEDGSGRGTPVVAFAQNQRGELRTSDVCPQLTCGGGKPVEGYPAAMQGPVVRRLMPVETARLQGFPDDHCAITYRGKPATDGPQYKAFGNSMAVPVIRWIMDRIRVSWETMPPTA